MKFVKNGNLTYLARTAISLIGGAIIFLSIFYIEDKVFQWIVGTVGLVIGSVGMYSAQSAMLKLHPMTGDPLGWRKAKATYTQAEKVTDEESSSTDEHKRSDP